MGQGTDELADWDETARAWVRHAEELGRHTRPVSEAILQLLALRPGEEVVELAAGTGELSRELAAAVVPGGSVICSDLAPRMVAAARQRHGATPGLDVRVLDAQQLPLPDDSVDAVVCKLGLALCPRPDLAAAECRRVLRRDGRLVVATWGAVVDNPWLTLLGIALLVNHRALPGDPTGPGGVFSLATADDLRGVLVGGGLDDVQVQTVDVPAHHASVDALWRLRAETSGPLTRVVRRLSADDVAAVRDTCIEHAAAYRDADGTYTLRGRALVALAR